MDHIDSLGFRVAATLSGLGLMRQTLLFLGYVNAAPYTNIEPHALTSMNDTGLAQYSAYFIAKTIAPSFALFDVPARNPVRQIAVSIPRGRTLSAVERLVALGSSVRYRSALWILCKASHHLVRS